MSAGFLSNRPWLLVWAAFVFLIAAWAFTLRLSHRAPSQLLTPAEEVVILEQRKGAR